MILKRNRDLVISPLISSSLLNTLRGIDTPTVVTFSDFDIVDLLHTFIKNYCQLLYSLNKPCYDPDLDGKILNVLNNSTNKQTNFNTLLPKLGISSRTLSKHLNVLDKSHIINWNRVISGNKGSIELSSYSKSIIYYWNPTSNIDYDKVRGKCREWTFRNKDSDSRKRDQRLVLFLLLAIARGYDSVKNARVRRDFERYYDQGNLTLAPMTHEEGVSISDFDRMDTKSVPIFNYLFSDRFSKRDIEKILKGMERNSDIQLRVSETGRYILEDNVLKELLIVCGSILKYLVGIMAKYWFILTKIPRNKQESDWFRFVVGHKNATDFFSDIVDNRSKKRSIIDLYIQCRYSWEAKSDPQFSDKLLNRESRNLFTRRGMTKKILEDSLELKLIHSKCEKIHKDYHIRHLLLDKKYQPFLKSLENIINPSFSKKMFDVKFTAMT